MEMKYTIGTGFFGSGEFKAKFAKTWLENTLKFTSAEAIFCLSCGGCPSPYGEPVRNIELAGNIGYHAIGQLYDHCGWSGSVMALAMVAYCNETDFIYKEQDCLAFGPWVEQMYSEIGSRKMLFGSIPNWFSANSLFLVKHQHIPWFVRDYLLQGDEKNDIPEAKFSRFLSGHKKNYGTFSFGYDRHRPVNYSDPVFYIQQVTDQEYDHMKEIGLI